MSAGPAPAEGRTHDPGVLEASTVSVMFRVEIITTLVCGHRLADHEITDLIEAMVDDLDRVSLEPSVGTARSGDDVEITISVTVDGSEQFDALTRAVSAMKAAFDTAGIGAAGLVVARDLRSQVTPLQAA